MFGVGATASPQKCCHQDQLREESNITATSANSDSVRDGVLEGSYTSVAVITSDLCNPDSATPAAAIVSSEELEPVSYTCC